jgi:hypothetical protein
MGPVEVQAGGEALTDASVQKLSFLSFSSQGDDPEGGTGEDISY